MNHTSTIPTSRPKKTTVRPTRASIARVASTQAKQQSIANNTPQRKIMKPSPTTSSSSSSIRSSTAGTTTNIANSNRHNDISKTKVNGTLPSRRSLPSTQPASASSTTSKLTKSRPSTVRNLGDRASASQQQQQPQPSTGAAGAAGAAVSPSSTSRKRKSLVTTKESLKKRPAWDMRGKISDLEAQLKKSDDQLKGLYKFRDELNVMKEDKESERKDAIQRAVALKVELQTLDKDHEQEIENTHAQQRIHHQELQDKLLIQKRRITTIEIELEDARRKYQEVEKRWNHVKKEHELLEAKQLKTTQDTTETEAELHRVELKLERFGGTLADRERDIAQQKRILEKEQPATDTAEKKLKEAQSNRQKLQAMIHDLQN